MSNGHVNGEESTYTARLRAQLDHTAARIVAYALEHNVPVNALRDIRLPWYEIRAQAAGERADDEPACTTVFIYDSIGGSMGVSAKALAAQLLDIDTPVIKVRINSPGGSVFDSITIFNALNHSRLGGKRVLTYVDGLAASGASVIAMAGEQIIMMPGSQMMIHDASMTQEGNAAEMGKAQTFLDRQSNNCAEIYAQARGGDPQTWRELMLAETWMFAREALEMGIADSIQALPAADPETDDALAGKMSRAFELHGRYRYAGRDHSPAPGQHRFTRRDTVTVTVGQTRTAPPVAGADGPMSANVAEAARLRKESAQIAKLGVEARSLMPLGSARRLSTGWISRTRPAAATLPSRIRMQEVVRDGKTFNMVEGYASVYERDYEMWDVFGPYSEIVSTGAGKASLATNPDVVFLVNHKGLAMARTVAANTLTLWEDGTGLGDQALLNPNRFDVKDLVSGIGDKITTEQSFAFMIDDGEWSPDFTTYRIHQYDINRGDVSAVNYGANPYTSVAARSREILEELDRMPVGAAREALARLVRRGDLDGVQMTHRPLEAAAPASSVTVDDPRPVGRSLRSLEEWLKLADARRGPQ